jgi:hypothetical protein
LHESAIHARLPRPALIAVLEFDAAKLEMSYRTPATDPAKLGTTARNWIRPGTWMYSNR